MNRESGFYWILLGKEWQVAEWYVPEKLGNYDPPPPHWMITGSELGALDEDCTKIDERKLINPNE